MTKEGKLVEPHVPEMTLMVCLGTLAFVMGFIAGMVASRYPKPDPHEPLAHDVSTPGSKVVAMPTKCGIDRRIKPSSAWPRTPVQRSQSQIERNAS